MANPIVQISGFTVNNTTNTYVECLVTSGDDPIIDKGVVWGDISGSTGTTATTTHNGSGDLDYTSEVTGTTQDTLYYVSAFVTTTGGTFYSNSERMMPLAGSVTFTEIGGSTNLVIAADENFALYTIIAGGGGGGDANGAIFFAWAGAGGGGAGGVIEGIKELAPDSYPIVIGSGGARNLGPATGSQGNNSTAFGFTAFGGGWGGVSGDIFGYPNQAGVSGGSGGGGQSYQTINASAGGAGIAGQGNAGSAGSSAFYHGGGGGGFASAGTRPTGGAGLVLNWDEVNVTYANGGKGGVGSAGAAGAAGTPNTGEGGSGAGDNTETLRAGGVGGSGVFLTLTGYNPFVQQSPVATYTPELVIEDIWIQVDIDAPSIDNVEHYELWRSDTSGGTYSFISSGITLSLQDTTPVYGSTYWYKVKSVGEYYEEWNAPEEVEAVLTMPIAPVISGGTTANSVELSWVDTNTWSQAYEIWRDVDSGGTTLYDTVTGTTYSDTNIFIATDYDYKVRSVIDYFDPFFIYSPFSAIESFRFDIILYAPSGTSASAITTTGVTLNWVNNNVSGITGNHIEQWNGSGWDIIDSVASGATFYLVTGLIPITNYIFRITAYNTSFSSNSDDIPVLTKDPTPFNITIVDIDAFQLSVTWSILDAPFGTSIRPEYRVVGSSTWLQKPLIAHDATSYTYTDLIINTNYEGRIVRIGSEYPSEVFTFTTEGVPVSFCEIDTQVIVTDSTDCGLSDGEIQIVDYDNYQFFYSFELTDIIGNVYTGFDSINGVFTGLSANYYFMSVTPISEYLRDSCSVDYIELNNDNNLIAITGETISNATCGSFNVKLGRNIIKLSDVVPPITTYKITLIDINGNVLLFEEINVTKTIILQELKGGDYFLIIDSVDHGCVILHTFTIPVDDLLSVPNIQKIFITEWSEGFDLNYWSTANDPDYFPALDTLKFQSTKIAEYATGLTWYSIIVDEINVNFSQDLSKVRQGFIFNDTLTIGIPFHDTDKWNSLTTLFGSRWVVVFLDANDNWWTFGYRHGAEAEDYTFGSELAGFTLSLKAVSENKIITAIDEGWVEDNIL